MLSFTNDHGGFEMEKFFWHIFEKSGNIEAFMCYKEWKSQSGKGESLASAAKEEEAVRI